MTTDPILDLCNACDGLGCNSCNSGYVERESDDLTLVVCPTCLSSGCESCEYTGWVYAAVDFDETSSYSGD